MTVEKLKELLEQLPSDALIECNVVRNLAITNCADEDVGYVDFSSETLELFAGEE